MSILKLNNSGLFGELLRNIKKIEIFLKKWVDNKSWGDSIEDVAERKRLSEREKREWAWESQKTLISDEEK